MVPRLEFGFPVYSIIHLRYLFLNDDGITPDPTNA